MFNKIFIILLIFVILVNSVDYIYKYNQKENMKKENNENIENDENDENDEDLVNISSPNNVDLGDKNTANADKETFNDSVNLINKI